VDAAAELVAADLALLRASTIASAPRSTASAACRPRPRRPTARRAWRACCGKRGARPERCLWAAAFRDDVDTIDLLVKHGATIDPITEDETPFLSAVKTSHFGAAARLLRHGANVNFQDSKGLTALHYALRKDSAPKHVEMLVRHGADPALRARDGKSPLDLAARRRDKTYFDLLTRRPGGR
jgi:ankyrin repeat protein